MNWKQAFAVGLIAPGMWDGRGEPIAYLYNGVRLPKLPEPQDNVNLVMMLTYTSTTTDGIPGMHWVLHIGRSVVYRNSGEARQVGIDQVCSFYCYDDSNVWTRNSSDYAGETYLDYNGGDYIKWTNTDILYEDGTVDIAASSPVPVGNGMMEYGSVRLPELPVFYMYKVIRYNATDDIYSLDVISQEATFSKNMILDRDFIMVLAPRQIYKVEDNQWILANPIASEGLFEFKNLVWSDHNICKTSSDEVMFYASDPIPVYE